MGSNPRHFNAKNRVGPLHPVKQVSWNYIVPPPDGFLVRLQAFTARAAAELPSEAEWEYAARANTSSARFWGDNPDDACKYANVADRNFRTRFKDWDGTIHDCEDGHVFTAPVGGGQAGAGYRFRPNAFGLYDMLGNTWEWTQDCHQATYDAKVATGRAFQASGSCGRRVLRGGSWFSRPDVVRSANRLRYDPGSRGNDVGFRVARTLP